MKLSEILAQLLEKRIRNPAPKSGDMQAFNAAMARKIMDMVAITQDEELTCDEVFVLLDQYVEKAVRGEDAGAQIPLVRQHLTICGDCREEFEALERVLRG